MAVLDQVPPELLARHAAAERERNSRRYPGRVPRQRSIAQGIRAGAGELLARMLYDMARPGYVERDGLATRDCRYRATPAGLTCWHDTGVLGGSNG